MGRSLPHDHAHHRGARRRVRGPRPDRQVRRGAERRHHHEVWRAQHPHDHLPQGGPGGRQAGGRHLEGGAEGQDRQAALSLRR